MDRIDWGKITAEGLDLLSRYIQVNTVNPPGNELPAARLLREKFLSAGIPAVVIEPEKDRGIIVARLHGVGRKKRSVVLLSHMDVVPATPEGWQYPPFSGAVKDGYVWGRGALDDKGPGVVALMAMLALKRAGILLQRDIVFIATGDEETGGSKGAGWLVKHRRKLFSDAGYLLNEGGSIHRRPHKGGLYYVVGVAEKSPVWLKLVATGPTGHGSLPPSQTAVSALVGAASRIIALQFEPEVGPLVRNYYRELGKLTGRAKELDNLAAALKRAAFRRSFLADPFNKAMVEDTVALTVLKAGEKVNVIPASAWAELDCRLLPNHDIKRFVARIQEAAGREVKVETIMSMHSPQAPLKTRLMAAIRHLARKFDHGAPVLPTMDVGFTDSHYFRELGIVSYGFVPIVVDKALRHTIHGTNERIPVTSFGQAIRRMAELLEWLGNH